MASNRSRQESFRSAHSAFILVLSLISSLSVSSAAADLLVAIQPLGKVDTTLVDAVKSEIELQYKVNVIVRPQTSLPVEAYYPSRHRYRAEKLLTYLHRVDKGSDKVVGLTTVDISTTKGIYPDWGILGYGNIGGHACVVSTFRMHREKVPAAIFNHRLAKVVAHELGHTFGLQHCPSKGCTMEDAHGTVKTVDAEKGFCDNCKKFLQPVLNPAH